MDSFGGNVYTNSNNVGIGTTSPGAELEVSGHIWQTGIGNSVFLGEDAGANDDLSNNQNVFIGYAAGNLTAAGSNNVAVGASSLKNATSSYNSAFGYQSLFSNTTGEGNTDVGCMASYSNQTGNYTSSFGYHALKNNTASNNSAFGYMSLHNNTTGHSNTASGKVALYDNTSGDYNTAIGFCALYSNTSGYNNTAIGYNAFSLGMAFFNSTALGYNASPNASNTIRLGNSSVSTIGGYVNWTNVSDGRFKTNVKENVAGLDFIMKLRPVTYKLSMDAIAKFNNTPDSLRLPKSEQLKEAELQIGFIAQEVENAANQIGFDFHGVDKPKNKESHYGLRYAEFVVPLVKAVQEQQQTIKTQEAAINRLENKLKECDILKTRFEKLEKLILEKL